MRQYVDRNIRNDHHRIVGAENIHTYRHTDRQTDIQTHPYRHTDRQTDRDIYIHTYTQTADKKSKQTDTFTYRQTQ